MRLMTTERWPGQLQCQSSMFFWLRVVASDCDWKHRPMIRLTWSVNVSCWSMVMPRQVTVRRRSTADPFIYYENGRVDLGKLISHTKTSKLCFPVLNFSLFEHTQWPTSSILVHDIKRVKIALQLSDDECKYKWMSSAYGREWRAHQQEELSRRNSTGLSTLPCGTG